jgi:thiamine pyrophosphate-dependent acetolactate synthase large subunit-like protein
MIQAGQGVLYAGASAELTEFAELLGAPVMTTMLGKSAFNERHPLSLGTAAYATTDMARQWLQSCDVIFGVGTSLTRGTFSPKIPSGKRFVHATTDPRDVNKDHVSAVALLGDARLVLRQLCDELVRQQGGQPPERRAAVERELAAAKERWRARWRPN